MEVDAGLFIGKMVDSYKLSMSISYSGVKYEGILVMLHCSHIWFKGRVQNQVITLAYL